MHHTDNQRRAVNKHRRFSNTRLPITRLPRVSKKRESYSFVLIRKQIAGDLIDPRPAGLSADAFMVNGVHYTVVNRRDIIVSTRAMRGLPTGTLDESVFG